MNKYKAFFMLSGLSINEAADFHNVRPDTIRKFISGKAMPPQGILLEFVEFLSREWKLSEGFIQYLEDEDVYMVNYCLTDEIAQSFGCYNKSSHEAMVVQRLFKLGIGAILKTQFVPREKNKRIIRE